MSLENSYIRNLTQKYRLAVAIAVLKEKPKNIPIEKYIEELRNKLKNEDDADLSICSDDFDIDDDDDIVNDIHFNKTNTFDGIDNEINKCTNLNNTDGESNDKFKYDNDDNINKDRSKSSSRNNNIARRHCIEKVNDNNDIEILNDTRFNEIRSDTNFVDDDNRKGSLDKTNKNASYSQNSKNLLKDYNGVFNDVSNCNQTDYVNIISYNILEQHNTKEREESTQPNVNNDLDLNSTYCKTQTNYQHNITENRININKSTLHINTASHNNDVIKEVNKPINIISTIDKATANNTRTIQDTYYDSEATELYTVHGFTNRTYNENALNKVGIPISSTKTLNDANEDAIDTTIHDFDSQATELYSVHGFTQNYTHVSQSQYCEQIVLNDKFIRTKSNRINENSDLAIKNYMEIVEKSDNIDVIGDENRNKSKNDDVNLNNHFDNPSIEVLNDHFNILPGHIDTTPLFNQNSMVIDDTFPIYAQDVDDITYEDNTNTAKEISENTERQLNRRIEIQEIEEVYNETEIVSFKVIEELNKVKNYINRRVERRVSNDGSTDSGYRSDSQKSTFRSSLQMSGNWLNQSAHSLYDYITQCPLLGTTQEIVNEIAQVLGQLIDKLHAEEKYPPFLEEILNYVEILLNDLMEDCEQESLMLKRDETTQRLLLLNKSIHIQKYTIEKISSILENLHSHLEPSGNTYEITNTSQIENIPYIFHILELILKQYLKHKVSSQDVKESTNELKRSSISDIWRRKWNINYTDDCIVDSIPKKCVVVKCSEILNKMIVSCMEGYSLISFAALHCFNILQS